MRYLQVYEMTDLKKVKTDGNISIYEIEVAGVRLPCQVMIRKMETHYRVEIGKDLRYNGGQWGFDFIFAFWTNFGLATPQTFRFGFEDEGKQALHMDRVFTNIREAQRGVKDWLLEEDGISHLQDRFMSVAHVKAAEAKRLVASSQMFLKLNEMMYGVEE